MTVRNVGRMNTVQILLIAALVVLLIGRRFTGRALDPRRSMIVPAAMAVYGFTLVRHSPSISRTDVVWLVASGAAAVVTGLIRGRSVRLYERDGVLWQRYQASTLVWWIVSIGARIAIGAAAVAAGADRSVMTSSTLLMFGVSLAAEAAIVLPRAFSSGVPIASRT